MIHYSSDYYDPIYNYQLIQSRCNHKITYYIPTKKDLRNNNETSNKLAEMSKLSADNHMPQIYQVNDSRFLLT